jgi:peptide/nickel transport system ATP-binding protein
MAMNAPRARADIGALVELKGVSKRFVKSLDLAARIGNRFGAGMKEEVVQIGRASCRERV